MSQQAVVIEINEVPLKIFKHYHQLRPNSHIAKLLENSLVLTTEAKDVSVDFLYPAQTWGSINTGAPYDRHQMHWYNDPKPADYPLYWKTIANQGLQVGLINTLHSSPANTYIDDPNYQFVIPDCFATNNLTKPEMYQDFQALNTNATVESGRTASLKVPKSKAIATLVKSPALGIKPQTLINAAGLVAKVKTGKVNRERLRNLQFNLMADMFLKQMRSNSVDLGILFTNHIAANMHRYWYALFPEDYERNLYSQQWTEKYSQEIVVAVELFDSFLGQVMKFCRQQQRALVLVSSMGQAANQDLEATPMYFYKLENVDKLIQRLCNGEQYNYRLDAAMVPQYSLKFDSAEQARKCWETIEETRKYIKNIWLENDLNDDVITLSTNLGSDSDRFFIRGTSYGYQDLGYKRMLIDDHSSGKHCPDGSLIVYNSKTSSTNSDRVDYLEYTPAMLNFFGITPPEYMVKPQFTI